MLNNEQKEWLAKQVKALQEKYEPQMPLSDEAWESMMLEINVLVKKSKMNVDVRNVFVIMTDYFKYKDKLEKELMISDDK